jgi:hypothetical protein
MDKIRFQLTQVRFSMTNVRGPLFSVSATGTVAKALTYKKGMRGIVCRKHQKPGGPPSSDQLYHRDVFKSIVAVWQNMTPEQHSTWNTLAIPSKLSGFNLFFKESQMGSVLFVEKFAADGQTKVYDFEDGLNLFAAGAIKSPNLAPNHASSEGEENICLGDGAGGYLTIGNDNFLAGVSAGALLTKGKHNICIGHEAGKFLQGGVDVGTNGNGFSNILIGFRAGQNLSGTDADPGANGNIFIGKSAGDHSTSARDNICLGHAAGYTMMTGHDNIFLGYQSGNGDGYSNICVGVNSGSGLTSGNLNVCMSESAGLNLTTGNQNVFIGYYSGGANTTQSYNTYLGAGTGKNNAGTQNIFIGYGGGVRQTAASHMLLISTELFANSATELTNSIIYGVGAASPLNQRLVFNAVVKHLSMSTTDRDALGSPVEGWMIYNSTTHTIDYYNGTAWKQLAIV